MLSTTHGKTNVILVLGLETSSEEINILIHMVGLLQRRVWLGETS